MEKKRFRDIKERDLQKKWGISAVPRLKALEDWLAQQPTIPAAEKLQLEQLRAELEQDALNWREEDLKMMFISPLLRLADLKNHQFRPFFDPKLSGEIKDVQLSGKVDMVVATGGRDPEQPFFFFHEYKPELEATADPRGQLLSAMILGQSKNEQKFPIYGCFVVGQIWYFVVLDHTSYAISTPFFATRSEDIIAIFGMLKQAKVYIERWFE